MAAVVHGKQPLSLLRALSVADHFVLFYLDVVLFGVFYIYFIIFFVRFVSVFCYLCSHCQSSVTDSLCEKRSIFGSNRTFLISSSCCWNFWTYFY